MAILPVQKGPKNKVLRAKSKPVKKVDKKIKKLIQDMTETMFDLNGVGIAAPQVGLNLRLAIARLNVDTKQEVIIPLINPEISHPSTEMINLEEGCLSLPGRWGSTPRHQSLTVSTDTLKGDRITLQLEGFNARIIQHEVDHLNGGLFIDRAHEVHEVKPS